MHKVAKVDGTAIAKLIQSSQNKDGGGAGPAGRLKVSGTGELKVSGRATHFHASGETVALNE